MKFRLIAAAVVLVFTLAACDRAPTSSSGGGGGGGAKEVVVYTSVDAPVARPILDEFERRTGVRVTVKTDAEASKTAGLVQTLRAERANPQADVFWNNEVFHTVNLAEEGVLAAYASPAAAGLAPAYRDARDRWAANGLRARVIARGPAGGAIDDVRMLADPAYRGKVCMANPAFGTTTGHVASWFVALGPEKAEEFLRQLKANDVRLLGGNSEVVKQIAAGNFVAGLTDNDDVDAIVREVGPGKVTAVPAAGPGGALMIPCTVGLIAGARNPEAAKQLIDYLLSAEVDQRLIAARFAATSVRQPPRLPDATAAPVPSATGGTPGAGAAVAAPDYAAIAKMIPRAVESSRKILEGRQ